MVKAKELIAQLFKFGIVGVIAFFIDYGILWCLTEYIGLWYLLSAFISFIISVTFNYFASMKYVFVPREDMSERKQFLLFVGMSAIGLCINEAGMWLLVDLVGIYYMISKIGVTAVVMVYNFITRKLVLERK